MNHGTHSGYNIHKQRGEAACQPCLAANRDYHRARYAATRLKNRRPDIAVAHIRALLARGATLRGIAAEAGLNVRHLGDIWRGQKRYIWPETEAAILGVQVGWSEHIPADGTIRRIQALRRIGWTCGDIGARLGISAQATHGITNRKRVSRDMAARVAGVYDELWSKPGPSTILSKRLAGRGIVGPLAWDDDTIDDPAAWANPGEPDGDHVDPVVVDRLVAGDDWRRLGASKAERAEAVDPMLRRGWPLGDVERHLGLRAGRDFPRPGREVAA